MIYLELFIEFIKIGLFTFGGAYGGIPVIQNSVLKNEWMDLSMFSNLLAVSESTPGPIMVNAATFIGYEQGGILGALVATTAVVLPSFVIIIVISRFLMKKIENPFIQGILKGIKPCIIGLIMATGLWIFISAFLWEKGRIDFVSLIILVILVFAIALKKLLWNKHISPILLIVFSAVLGIIFY